jgi:hypothetical protein
MNPSNATELSVTRTLKNWADRQHPPKALRTRLLLKAASQNRRTQAGKQLILRIKRFANPYWTGQNLSYAELSRWLFSRAMVQCLNMDRFAARAVC